MGKANGPPKCRTCGVEEWGHTCKGAIEDKRRADPKRRAQDKLRLVETKPVR